MSDSQELTNTTIKLGDKHREIAEKRAINISKFTRKKLEELEE